jgi:hypothetical protein
MGRCGSSSAPGSAASLSGGAATGGADNYLSAAAPSSLTLELLG